MDNTDTLIEQILAHCNAHLDEQAIRAQSQRLRQRAKREELDALLPEAFALFYQATQHTLGVTPFHEQLGAGIAMHRGRVTQMGTGEGKTLSAVAPAYLNALTGRVHILTFNDYLAKRDCLWMRPIFELLGVSVGYVTQESTLAQRLDAYSCDVVYLTAKEAGFDFLRDFLCTDASQIRLHQLDFAIVDEADSILIDEGRIPLVIAGQVKHLPDDRAREVDAQVRLLLAADYERNTDSNSVSLTDSGMDKLEDAFGVNLYDEEQVDLLSHINCSLQAHFMLRRDVNYIVRGDQILLVDEFTGRVAENRHYPDNLHDAVEAKEGVSSFSRGMILGTIALQYFMRQYQKLAGMTGTATTAKDEFRKLYDLEITQIPPHKPCIRKELALGVYTHSKAKWDCIAAEIRASHARGQPVLVGTADIAQSEALKQRLAQEGMDCAVLNAKNDADEAQIIEQAGNLGRITISTNMAGRGVDIKLGGPDEKNRDAVVAAGGLYVIGTCMHESERIDRQLIGRCARQGDVGQSKFFVCLEDEIMVRHDVLSLIPKKHHPKTSDAEVTNPVVLREVARIQRIAQGVSFDMRTHLLKYSHIIEAQRSAIFARRRDVLTGAHEPNFWQETAPKAHTALCEHYGEAAVRAQQNKCMLTLLNRCWAEHLDYTAYLREGIHLTAIAGKNPLEEFNIAVEAAYRQMQMRFYDEMTLAAKRLLQSKPQALSEYDDTALHGPSATWTYLMDDSTDQFSRLPHLMQKLKGSRPKATPPPSKSTGFVSKALRFLGASEK